jgi:hypothetical protein
MAGVDVARKKSWEKEEVCARGRVRLRPGPFAKRLTLVWTAALPVAGAAAQFTL